MRRLRADDPTRPIGDALIDQRMVAGIGNMWKSEGCFAARDRPLAAHRRRAATTRCWPSCARSRPRMQESAPDGILERFKLVYGKAGAPCPRCGEASRIRPAASGEDNRMTFWCPRCQR